MLDTEKNLRKKADLGWAAMQARLDQEMPTNERQRRPIFWWFLTAGAIGFGVAAGAVWAVSGLEKKQVPVSPLAAEQAVAVSPKTPQHTQNQPFTNEIKIETAPPEASLSAQNLPNHLEKKAAFSTSKRLADAGFVFQKGKKGTPKTAVILSENESKKGAFQTPFLNQTEAVSTLILIEKVVENPEKVDSKMTQKSTQLEPFSPLQKRAFEPLFWKEKPATLSFSESIFPIPKKQKGLKTGLFLAAQTLNFQQSGGFAIGVSAEKKVSKKVALRGSLLFNHLRRGSKPTVAEGFTAEFEHNYYLDETQDTALLYAELGQLVTIQPTQTGTPNGVNYEQYLNVSGNVFNRMDAQIQANYRLGSRFQIGAGGAFSKLLKAKSVGLTQAPVGATSIFGDSKISADASVNALLSQSLPRFDALVFGSIGYDFSKKWRLELSHHLGLKNQNAVDGHSKKNRFWRLSATRWF